MITETDIANNLYNIDKIVEYMNSSMDKMNYEKEKLLTEEYIRDQSHGNLKKLETGKYLVIVPRVPIDLQRKFYTHEEFDKMKNSEKTCELLRMHCLYLTHKCHTDSLSMIDFIQVNPMDVLGNVIYFDESYVFVETYNPELILRSINSGYKAGLCYIGQPYYDSELNKYYSKNIIIHYFNMVNA